MEDGLDDGTQEQIDSRLYKNDSHISGINLDGSIEASMESNERQPYQQDNNQPGNPFNKELMNVVQNDFGKPSDSEDFTEEVIKKTEETGVEFSGNKILSEIKAKSILLNHK